MANECYNESSTDPPENPRSFSMTREQFNSAAADQLCVFTIHLKENAFGLKDPRDRAYTFLEAVEQWTAAQDQKVQSSLVSCAMQDAEVRVIGTGHAMALLDDAFAKEISWVGVHDYTPPPAEKPALPHIKGKGLHAILR